MSIFALLVCGPTRSTLGLGKPLRRPDGTIATFAHRSAEASDATFARALWKFLDGCAAGDLRLCLSGDADFDDVAGYPEVGGEPEDGGTPFDVYLAGDPEEPVTYYAKLRPGYPRADPSGIVRRRHRGPATVDEAFTRSLRWEPTEYLNRHALGLDDTDHVEITEAEAVDFALRALASRLRPQAPVTGQFR